MPTSNQNQVNKDLKIGNVKISAKVVKVRNVHPRVLVIFRKFDKELGKEIEIPLFFGDTSWSEFVEFLKPVFEEYRKIKPKKKSVEVDSQRYFEVKESERGYWFVYKRFDSESNRWITGNSYFLPRILAKRILRKEVLENV